MSRATLFRLRVMFRGQLAVFLPLDYAHEAHVHIGIIYFFVSILHISGHLCNFLKLSQTPQQTQAELFPQLNIGFQWEFLDFLFRSTAGITGIICTIIILLVFATQELRNLNFPIFWTIHHLLFVFTISMIIHGSQELLGSWTTLHYILLPVTVYVLDRLYRFFMNDMIRNDSPVVDKVNSCVVDVGGNKRICKLVMSRPKKNFNHKAGAYAFIKIPKISKLEWHPFTIVSTPSDDCVTFYIKDAGDWTGDLMELADRNTINHVRLYGPCSAPAMEWGKHHTNIFIAAGVGITPYLSIMKHILETKVSNYTHLIWACRTMEELWIARDLIIDCHKDNKFSLHLYCTGSKTSVMYDESIDLEVSSGRPKMDILIREIYEDIEDKTNSCGLFSTTPKVLQKSIAEVVTSCKMMKTYYEVF
eukprot:Awhi_evm1s5513